MEKRKGRLHLAVYCKPLPLTLSVDKYGQLPMLTGHNPVLWLMMAYSMIALYSRRPPQVDEPKVEVEVCQPGPSFHVRDESQMMKLWQEGFFGKGTLSRSDPLWRQRQESKAQGRLEKEDVTLLRRDERRMFKTVRASVQQYETLARTRPLTALEAEEYATAQAELDRLQKESTLGGSALPDKAEPEQPDLRALAAVSETLQLQGVEVFFLEFAVNAVRTTAARAGGVPTELGLDGLFRACLQSNLRFVSDYVVYHHFRSLGWCVRSGIKFGCDMLLYKRGPPFMHAEYAVMVVSDGWTTWEDFMAVARVVSGVKKTLVLVQVDGPSGQALEQAIAAPMTRALLRELFSLYKVTEVVYHRWSPSRTRD